MTDKGTKIERPDDLVWVKAALDGYYGLSPSTQRFIEEGEFFQCYRRDLSPLNPAEGATKTDMKGKTVDRQPGWMEVVKSSRTLEKAQDRGKINEEPRGAVRGPDTHPLKNSPRAVNVTSGEKEHEPEVEIEDDDRETTEIGPEAEIGPGKKDDEVDKEDREPPGRPPAGLTVKRKKVVKPRRGAEGE